MSAIRTFAERKAATLQDAPHGYDALGDLSVFKLFDFGRKNPNTTNKFLKPLKALGKNFSEKLCNEIKLDHEKETQANAFQEICRLRNLLAHNDLIAYHDDALNNKTCDEINTLHGQAIQFVDLFKQKLT